MLPEGSQPASGDRTEPREPAPLTFPSPAVHPPRPSSTQGARAAHAVVKPEPVEPQIASGSSQPSTVPQSSPRTRAPEPTQASPPVRVKPESQPKHIPTLEPQRQVDVKPELPIAQPYTTYASAEEIDYTPENALAVCAQTAAAVENYLIKLNLGDLRKNIWFRDIESFKNQAAPRTMIAVCGATGSGKSSLLNGLLDDNIVPTSGMRACTAVVTEISYHDKDSIAADVEFLARPEWKTELEILREELVEENGKLKRLTDLRSDAGIAWAKMHAVYPHLKAERMVTMTPDEIIDSKPEIARILGTIKHIDSPDSEKFSSAIAKYVDSKDPKSSRRKHKKSAGDKPKGDEPALWPLIRLVRVRAKSKALSGGAVLVDLPGVADANLARSSIAKEYMKKCDCIWIAAPITRAVDDKAAKDLLGEAFRTQLMNGNYDAGFITFIATKTDDLSCTEVIGGLGLDDNPELVEIEAKLEAEQVGLEESAPRVKELAKEIRKLETENKKLKPILSEYKDHLKALKAGKPFKPVLTAPKQPGEGSPKKRKKGSGGRKAKRTRLSNDDDFLEDDSMDLDLNDSFIDERDEIVDTDIEDALVEGVLDQGDVIEIDSDSDEVIVLTDSDDPDDQPKAKVTLKATPKATPESEAQKCIKKSIQEMEAMIRELSEKMKQLDVTRKEAVSKVNGHKKAASMLQKEKNAFCSKKRNEYSKGVLKEDFRRGLKELDQADEEAKNPETFDPSVELRDYNAIDLPVFTCSSRDYIRINKQVKGDGGPSCFTNPEDTEVPSLQDWCHTLTLTSRERTARTLLHGLSTFLRSIKSYVDKMEGVNVADYQVLAKLWDSTIRMVQIDDSLGLTQAQINPPPVPPEPPVSEHSRRGIKRNASLQPPPDTSLNGTTQRAKRILELPRYTHSPYGKGISFQLRRGMKKVAANCVGQLKHAFREGIEGRCLAGAVKARRVAVETSDAFATLRRNGEWKGDLNADLVGPMTREIAASWARVFDSDLFAPTVQAERQEITTLLKEVEDSAPPDLRARSQVQSDLALKEAEMLTTNLLANLKTMMTNEQKDISRCLTPYVQKELLTAYESAASESGAGSVARQKKLFRDHVETSRGTLFSKGTQTLFDKLDQAAEQIGVLLELGLSELAEKIEVNMSVLWDIPRAGKEEAEKRRNLIHHIDNMLHQLELWLAASKTGGAKSGGAGKSTTGGIAGAHSEDPGVVNAVGCSLPVGTCATRTGIGADADEEDLDEDEGGEEEDMDDDEGSMGEGEGSTGEEEESTGEDEGESEGEDEDEDEDEGEEGKREPSEYSL